MRTILMMIRKEFQSIKRNRQMLPIIFLMPVVQLLILVNAATFEIKSVNMVLLDNDKTETSRQLFNKFVASGYFVLTGTAENEGEAEEFLMNNSAKMILRIPANFEKDLMRENSAKVQTIINAEDGAAAGVIGAYSSAIVSGYSATIAVEKLGAKPVGGLLDIRERYFYNPELEYKHYMVPGILGVLVTVIGFALAGLNLVREKEIGTIEQLNVTPIKKYQFIAGKMLPFWIIGLFDMALGLLIAKFVFDIFIVGSLLIIFSAAAIYLMIVLSFGLIVSSNSSTQQQSLFVSYFILLIIILMSGLFTPIESMPSWAQYVAFVDPFSHFAEVMRRVLLKGASWAEVSEQFAILGAYATLAASFAVFNYKKVAD